MFTIAIFGKPKSHITLIQETHSTESTAKIWEIEWGGQAIFYHGSSRSRGVAILFGRNFSPKILKKEKDEHGRILAVDIEVEGDIYTLVSLYAPTQDKPWLQAEFMDNLESILESMDSDNLILRGYLNLILDPLMDRNSSSELPVSSEAHRN